MIKKLKKKVSDVKEFKSLFSYYQFTKSHYSELEERNAHPELIKRWREEMVSPALKKVLAHVYRNITDTPEDIPTRETDLHFSLLLLPDNSRQALNFLKGK